MLTSKERAQLRAQANDLEVTLIIGKDGITENTIAEAERQLEARELVKGKVLETALLSAREACDTICEATGADGVSCVGYKFIFYRESEKLKQQRNQVGRAKRAAVTAAKANPVRKGAQARRKVAHAERERRNEYFKAVAVERSIEKSKAKKRRLEERGQG